MSEQHETYDRITTVIFDMDGTLIEHTWQLTTICEALFARFADKLAPLTADEFFDCYWDKSYDMWHMMVDQVIDGNTAAQYAYANTLRALGHDPGLAGPMLDYWVELVLQEAVPFDDTYDVLKAIRQKYTTGILTNGYIHLQRQKIEKYGFAACVDFTIISEESGYHKPDRRVFEHALALAGRPAPEEVLFVGDNLDTDISGALGAGLVPVLIDTKDRAEPPEGVLEISTLAELLQLLKVESVDRNLRSEASSDAERSRI
ncbi:MAG: HAD family hydrolase [Anaerolineae bacterium]|nr:HAD family hydrolase [Anaerolineae bacterium]